MKKIIFTTLGILSLLAQIGCGPLFFIKTLEVSIIKHDKILTGTYNFITAHAECVEKRCLDDCVGTVAAESIQWSWTDLPDEATEPAIIESSMNEYTSMIAFIPVVPGHYTLTATVECPPTHDNATKTIVESFTAENIELQLKSTVTLPDSEGINLEENNEAVSNAIYGSYDECEDWYSTDFNSDDVEETLIAKGPLSWTMLLTTENEVEELFDLQVVQDDNDMDSINYILGVNPSDKVTGNPSVYAYGENSEDDWVIIKYSLNYATQTLTLSNVLNHDNLVAKIGKPMVVLNNSVVFFGTTDEDADLDENGEYLDTILSLDKTTDELTIIGEINIPYDRSYFIDFYDYDDDGNEEIVYKIGSKYFVYEQTI